MDFAVNYLKCGKNTTEMLQQMCKTVNLTIADLNSTAGHIVIV